MTKHHRPSSVAVMTKLGYIRDGFLIGVYIALIMYVINQILYALFVHHLVLIWRQNISNHQFIFTSKQT